MLPDRLRFGSQIIRMASPPFPLPLASVRFGSKEQCSLTHQCEDVHDSAYADEIKLTYTTRDLREGHQ